jgi:Tfp pilus assembly protein FimV
MVQMTAMTINQQQAMKFNQQQLSNPVRLTRRGRVVVVLGLLAALLTGGFTLGHAPSEATGRTHLLQPRTVTVQAGDTLWTVAERIAPHVDPRLVVAQIQQLNHLESPQLLAGTQLVVPRSR